jgi:hypothetical protein
MGDGFVTRACLAVIVLAADVLSGHSVGVPTPGWSARLRVGLPYRPLWIVAKPMRPLWPTAGGRPVATRLSVPRRHCLRHCDRLPPAFLR